MEKIDLQSPALKFTSCENDSEFVELLRAIKPRLFIYCVTSESCYQATFAIDAALLGPPLQSAMPERSQPAFGKELHQGPLQGSDSPAGAAAGGEAAGIADLALGQSRDPCDSLVASADAVCMPTTPDYELSKEAFFKLSKLLLQIRPSILPQIFFRDVPLLLHPIYPFCEASSPANGVRCSPPQEDPLLLQPSPTTTASACFCP